MSLRVERSAPGVALLLLDRPERRNALDLALVEELLDAFGGASARTIVLASTDPACFCAGADVTVADAERARVSERLYELYATMVGLDVPIVAAVSGHAVGGGAQLALASDLRVGTPHTRIRLAGPGHGLAVGAWGLPSLVGRGRALDLCLTMRPVGADEALAMGLLDRIADDARAAAIEIATALAALDAAAVGRVKGIVRRAADLPALLEMERQGNQTWSGSLGDRSSSDEAAP